MQTISQRIDELMEKASQALVQRRYFQCERLCLEALSAAHGDRDYARMARIVLPLQESRRLKVQLALDAASGAQAPRAAEARRKSANGAATSNGAATAAVTGGAAAGTAVEGVGSPLWGIGGVYLIDTGHPTPADLRPGCYLVQPPRVGLDGRVLRQALDDTEVPGLVVVREPTTRAGLWPLVALGPVTVRVHVPPPGPGSLKAIPGRMAPYPPSEPVAPAKPAPKGKASGGGTAAKKTAAKGEAPAGGAGGAAVAVVKPGPMHPEGLPDAAWFVEAVRRLGDAAIEQVDQTRSVHSRVDELLLRLETLPAHELLHQRLHEACLEAAQVPVPATRGRDELDDEPDLGEDED